MISEAERFAVKKLLLVSNDRSRKKQFQRNCKRGGG